MKFLGKEFEVKVESRRTVEYVRCDKCNKKILPAKFLEPQSSYFRAHTWHDDWGNDSIESHEYKDLCADCVKSFVERFIDNASGTDQLELSYEYLSQNETERSIMLRASGFKTVDDDFGVEAADNPELLKGGAE